VPRVRELLDDAQNLGDELGVQGAGHLVEQHDAGPHGQSPHDGDALLLPAGEAVRVLVLFVEQAEAVEELQGSLFRAAAVHAQGLARGEGDVPRHRHVGEQVEGLVHDADGAADAVHVHASCRYLLSFHHDTPGIYGLDEVDAPEQRGLARAGRPDQTNHLVRRDCQVYALQHLVLPERLADALEHEGRGAHAIAPASRRRLSRRIRRSVKRARGMVIRTNRSAAMT
jgi:hypothetical protein